MKNGEMTELFAHWLAARGIILSERQKEQFETYYALLIQWNGKMNLTAITDRRQVYTKHFYDSLSLAFFLDFRKPLRFADIGSGAGFPGIPLKIVFPHLQIVMIDALQKRIQFLRELVQVLQLQDVQTVHMRAEDAARLSEYRDGFDLVTARAVARLRVLNEWCLPFVKTGGYFAAMKGAQAREELEEAGRSLRLLQGALKEIHSLSLPGAGDERHIIVIEKKAATPAKFPRKAGTAAKQPL